MNKQVKGLLPLILIPLLLFNGLSIFAQPNVYPEFEVVKFEKEIKYDLEKLNKEIKLLHDKEALRKLLKSKNFPPNEMIIRIKHNQSLMSWLRIDTRKNKETESGIIVLQSKNTATQSFNKISDFKMLFKDTLVLIEDLSINLYIHDDDYPDDQYYVNYSCDSENNASSKIKLKDKYILTFDDDLIAKCKNIVTSAQILNYNKPGRVIATFHVIFLDKHEKDNLLEIAQYFIKQNGSDFKSAITFISNYCQSFYGTPLYSQLSDWLTKKIVD